jgi:hypothetical protein
VMNGTNKRLTAADHLAGCLLLNPELRAALRPDEAAVLAAQDELDPEELAARVRLETDNDPERLICHFRECVRHMRIDAGMDKPAGSSAMRRLSERLDREDDHIPDFATTQVRHLAAVEMAYRRGYAQGYFRGSEDERKHGPDKVADHWNDAIMKWRYKRPIKIEFPPELGGVA